MARGGAVQLSRPLQICAVALAAVTLVSIFIVVGFPYDRLADYIATEVQRSSGLRITIGDLRPALQLRGLGVRARDVAVEGEGSDYHADHVSLRPAWSMSWLRGEPAVHADIEGPLGSVVGTYTMGTQAGWKGVLENIDLAAPPVRRMLPNLYLTGRGGADLNVKQGLMGPEGSIRFELTQGSIAFGDFPLVVPYESVAGSLTLGDEAYLTIAEFTFTGPLMTADATGKVLSSPTFSDAPLAIALQIHAEPALQITLASAGVRFDKDGLARVRVTGTPLQPVLH